MRITYSPTGIDDFHNRGAINLNVSGEQTYGYGGAVYYITSRQAARIRRHFCGVKDCGCPSGAVQQLNESGTEWGIRATRCEEGWL